MNIRSTEQSSSTFQRVKKSRLTKYLLFIGYLTGMFLLMNYLSPASHAQVRIPGQDESQKLESAGVLLRIADTFIFSWGARIFAGVCILSAGWSLKEQRYASALICVVAAIVIATAPTWIKNSASCRRYA